MASDGSVVIDIKGNSKPFEQSINQSLQSLKNSFNGINSEISSASGAVSGFGTNASQARTSVQGLGTAVSGTNNGISSLGQSFGTANRNILSLGASSSAANSGIQQIGSASLTANNNVQLLGACASQAQGSLQRLGANGANSINALAAAFAAAGLANVAKSLVNALGDCINTFASFESQMATVQAISGASATEMQQLTEKAKEMGATTSFTAEQAGQALEYMAMAGWKTQDMLDGLDGVMNLAAASGEDLGSVSDILTDAITAFGDSAADAGRYADVLASAASNANTDVRGIGEACKYVAPIAGTLGYSIEDVSIALGLMANSSVKSSMAGTSLRSMLNSLSGTNQKANKAFEELNFSMTDQSNKIKPLRQSLSELRDKLRNLSEAQQNQYAKSIAGTMGMSGFLAIVNSSDEDFDKLTSAIDNSAGAAERMANIRLDNLQGSLTLLGSAFDGLKLTIGEQLAPAVKTVIDAFTWFLNTVNSLAERFPVFGAVVAGFTAEITLLAAAFAGLSIIKLLTPLVLAFNAACDANPYIQVALAIVAVGTAVSALIAHFTDSKKAADESATAMDNEASAADKATASLNEFNQTCSEAEAAGKKVADGVKSSEDAYNEFEKVTRSAITALEDLEGEYDEAQNAAKESIESQNNLWDDLSDAVEEGGLNLKKALESQVDYWRTFSKDVETLNGKQIDGLKEVTQELVKGANEGSKEAVSALHWMAQQNDYSLNQVIEKYSDLKVETERAAGYSAIALTDYGDRVSQVFNGVSKSANALDLSAEARQAGIHTMEGYINGLNSKKGSVDSAMKNAGRNSFNAFTKSLDEHSPSKLFKKSGIFAMEGYEIGVKSKSRDISDTMENTAQNIIKSFNVKLPEIDNDTMKRLNDIVSAGSASIKSNIIDFGDKLIGTTSNAGNNTSPIVNRDNDVSVTVNYYGNAELEDAKKISRQIGVETSRELRRRGITAT